MDTWNNIRTNPSFCDVKHYGLSENVFIIWSDRAGRPVQSDFGAAAARRNCGILNDHETKNGREPCHSILHPGQWALDGNAIIKTI